MTEYAIILYFDGATKERFFELMHLTADACGNSYMLDQKIPPHITVCYFKADDYSAALELVNKKAITLKREIISWPSLGAFVPHTLFAAPTLNEYLLNRCADFNELLSERVSLVDYYRPFKWIPHSTLATRLTAEQLNKAFEAVSLKFTHIEGAITALSFVRCEPFSEIMVWPLK